MSDTASPLPWTETQWAELREAARQAANKSRIANTFLPLVGPLPPEQATVPANWMTAPVINERGQRGEARQRLEVRAGKTLQLVTIASNIYLRGSEVAEPGLDSAKAMVRRAAEVLGRLEDAVVFHGLPKEDAIPKHKGKPVVHPLIYTVSGGHDLTGLLQAPDTVFFDLFKGGAEPTQQQEEFKRQLGELRKAKKKLREAEKEGDKAKIEAAKKEVDAAHDKAVIAQKDCVDDLMSVRVPGPSQAKTPIVDAVVTAIQRLERQGHFGPFAVVLGHGLFSEATTPSTSLVLPSDRLVEFLDGRRVTRSGTLPPEDGLVVALGGQVIELVLARDLDLKYLQTTLEPRYVLRVFEKFVLRIKELDAVCRITKDELLVNPGFKLRRANS